MLWLAGCLYISDADLAARMAGDDLRPHDSGKGDSGSVDTADTGDGHTSDTDTGSTSTHTDETAALAPHIEYLDPSQGDIAGGTTVTIHGEHLDGARPTVTFGGSQATLLAQDASFLQVSTPSTSLEGPVEVVVQTDDGTDSLFSAFTYTQEAVTGAVTLLGAMASLHRTGEYLASARPYELQAWIKPISPEVFSITDLYAPALDTCTMAAPVVIDALVGTGGAADANLEGSDGSSYDLNFDAGSDRYLFDEVVTSLPSVGTVWTAKVPEGSGGSVLLPDVVTTCEVIQVSEPELEGATMPTLRERPTIKWSVAAGAKAVLITLTRMDSSYLPQETVTCAAVDDGEFTPSSDLGWSAYPSGEFVSVEVSRACWNETTPSFAGGGALVFAVDTSIGVAEIP